MVDLKDPYIDPLSGCLKNILNIKNKQELDRIESTLTFIRSCKIKNDPIHGSFDISHLKNIHHYLFQDIYAWAGQIRTIDTSKGYIRYAHYNHIEREAKKLLDQLKEEKYLKDLNSDQFAQRAGYYLGEINSIHLFREGNSRTQREFIDHLARHNNYHIEWSNMTRDQMKKATTEAFYSDSKQLSKLIRANLSDQDYEKAKALAYKDMYSSVNIEQAQEGQTYQGKILAETQRYFIQQPFNNINKIIIHSRLNLLGEMHDLHNKDVEIKYPCGRTGLIRPYEYTKNEAKHKELDSNEFGSNHNHTLEK